MQLFGRFLSWYKTPPQHVWHFTDGCHSTPCCNSLKRMRNVFPHTRKSVLIPSGSRMSACENSVKQLERLINVGEFQGKKMWQVLGKNAKINMAVRACTCRLHSKNQPLWAQSDHTQFGATLLGFQGSGHKVTKKRCLKHGSDWSWNDWRKSALIVAATENTDLVGMICVKLPVPGAAPSIFTSPHNPGPEK